ncbi:hypothetical protein ACFCX3_18920 [Streptomyces virginiae]|uniref:hypothetical protein n=1 Tax=Streptomyces virginiae TaxID=1961 RepID=UPI0035DA34B6
MSSSTTASALPAPAALRRTRRPSFASAEAQPAGHRGRYAPQYVAQRGRRPGRLAQGAQDVQDEDDLDRRTQQ